MFENSGATVVRLVSLASLQILMLQCSCQSQFPSSISKITQAVATVMLQLSIPHSFANFHVIRDLEAKVGGRLEKSSKSQIRVAAKTLLEQDTRRLNMQ